MLGLIIGVALALGGPVPPDLTSWFHDDAPAVVAESDAAHPVLTPDPFASGPVVLTEPFPELTVDAPRFDLSTGIADGPTSAEAVLRRGDRTCALVVQGGRALGGLLCVDRLTDGSIVPRELEPALVTNERPFDGVFRYDGGVFALLGDEVLALDSAAMSHIPDKRGDSAQFFAMLTRRAAEADAVSRLGGDAVEFSPPLLGPQDHPEWDALVAEGLTFPEGYAPPPEPMYPGPENGSEGMYPRGAIPGSAVAWAVAGTLLAVGATIGWYARRRQTGIVDVSMTKR